MMKQILSKTQFLTVIILFLGSITLLNAQSRKDRAGQSPLFLEDEILAITISMDLERVTKDIEDREEHQGTVAYKAADGTDVLIDVMFKTRGKTRANPEVCKFPPLQLNFKKKGIITISLRGKTSLNL